MYYEIGQSGSPTPVSVSLASLARQSYKNIYMISNLIKILSSKILIRLIVKILLKILF